jgi:hypothetical protein
VRFTIFRIAVWSGGSIMIIALGGSHGSSVIASNVMPCSEENVSVSSEASRTSSNRLNA